MAAANLAAWHLLLPEQESLPKVKLLDDLTVFSLGSFARVRFCSRAMLRPNREVEPPRGEGEINVEKSGRFVLPSFWPLSPVAGGRRVGESAIVSSSPIAGPACITPGSCLLELRGAARSSRISVRASAHGERRTYLWAAQ